MYFAPQPLNQSQVFIAQPQITTLQPVSVQAPLVPEPKKNKHQTYDCVLYVTILAFLLTLAVISGFISFGKYTKLQKPHNDLGVLQNVANNLKATPFTDIKTVVAQSTKKSLRISDLQIKHKITENICGKDYDEQAFGFWEGVEDGCICSDGSTHSKFYCHLKSSNDCKWVKSEPKKQILKWNSKQICTKRASSFQWLGSNSQDCKKTFCQGSNVCVSDDVCPVNDLIQATAPAPINIGKGFKTSSPSKTDNSAKQPIIGFALVPGVINNRPCYDDNLSPKFQSGTTYGLLSQKPNGCKDSLQDDTALDGVIQIDNQVANTIYTANKITKIYEELPFAKKLSADDTVNLVAVRRFKIGSHKTCDQVKPEQIDSVVSKVNYLDNLIYWTATVLFYVSTVILVLALILFLLKRNNKIQSIPQTRLLAIIAIVLAITVIVSVSIYIHQVEKKNGLKEEEKFFSDIIGNDCFPIDKPITKALENVNTYAKQSYEHFWNLEVTLLVISIILLVLLAALVYYGKKIGTPEPFFDPWRKD